MVSGSRVEKLEIDVPTAQSDNERVGTFDNSMGYVFYSRGHQKNSVGAGTSAVDIDVDWIAADVPCLGSEPIQGLEATGQIASPTL